MNMMTALRRPYVASPSFLPRRAPQRFRRMLALFERDEIEDAVEALLAYLDALGGDPDVEAVGTEDDFVRHNADGPGCPVADAGDHTYAEWDSLHSSRRRAGNIDGIVADVRSGGLHEDDEDEGHSEQGAWTEWDGRSAFEHHLGAERIGAPNGSEDDEAEEDMCLAGDDQVVAGPVMDRGRWLDDWQKVRSGEIGDEHDAEHCLATNNVPVDPVHALEPNIFNGKRAYLGHSNLLTSFRSNGGTELSADTGRKHRLRGDAPVSAGVPV